jgi:hypothetical protein
MTRISWAATCVLVLVSSVVFSQSEAPPPEFEVTHRRQELRGGPDHRGTGV